MKDIPALAFPHKWETTDGTTIIAKGMTLRDYFAGRAMQGMLSENSGIRYPTDELVDFAYKVADAMIFAREKK